MSKKGQRASLDKTHARYWKAQAAYQEAMREEKKMRRE